MYTERNVMISSAHTHSAPGGFMLDVLFDLTTFGFVRESFDAIVNGITKSIQRGSVPIMLLCPGESSLLTEKFWMLTLIGVRRHILIIRNPKEINTSTMWTRR
ncbi:neutral ceramidase-like [Temnothorax longispinosus]|uniref:neutral ceramidase-like n=1 Tax=Temnothorax longispinosus TaxID=300112 RepID=UPI003A99C343